MNRHILILAAVAATLCSCSAYRTWHSPVPEPLDALYASDDSTGLAGRGWQEFFTDSLLRSYIARGLENNRDLRVASLRIGEYEQALKSARLAYLPSVEISPSGSYTYSDGRYSGWAHSWSLPVAASWEADIAGRQTAARKAAQTALEQSRVWQQSAQTALIASIANAYYTLELLDRKLDISRKTAQSWKENVRIMKAMKQVGMANEASVSHTEANSLSIETSIFDLERQLAEAENQLALLLGEAPSSRSAAPVHARGRLKDADFPDELATGVPAELLARRPDVMDAELELRKAYYNTLIARADLYPSLRLTGSVGWEKALALDAPGLAATLAGSIVQPVLSARKRRAALETAKLRQEEALAAFEQSIMQAGSDVNNAIAQCNAARAKHDLRLQQIEALETAERSTRELMRHSEATYLEVLTAQQSLLSARLLQATDRYDETVAIISLYRALGGR